MKGLRQSIDISSTSYSTLNDFDVPPHIASSVA